MRVCAATVGKPASSGGAPRRELVAKPLPTTGTRTLVRRKPFWAGLELDRGAVPLDLVDTRGAKDSFIPGLLDGLHRADLVGGARRDALAAIDEDAFRALSGKRIGIFVGHAGDPGIGDRGTPAAFVLDLIEEGERFLDTLAR